MKKKTMLRLVLGLFIGGALGFAYFYFVGCRTGTCPITSHPMISTAYGSLLGVLIAWR